MIRSVFCLVKALWLIRTKKIEDIRRILQQRKMNCAESWTIDEAEKAAEQMDKLNRFFFIRIACLERSLALSLLATSCGKKVDWIVGVKLSPFASHAWIEVEGKPVKEMENLQKYKKMVVV